MIARLWSASTTPAEAHTYTEHLKAHVLRRLQQVEGYVGAMLLHEATDDAVEILLITWWKSLDAIKGFAGEDIGRAVVADEAVALLKRFDREVRHYEVVVRDRSFSGAS